MLYANISFLRSRRQRSIFFNLNMIKMILSSSNLDKFKMHLPLSVLG